MGDSLDRMARAEKCETETESPQVVWANPENPHTPRRAAAADVTRRATWRITKIAAADLGLSDSTIQMWTCGDRRSPVEKVDILTERALKEGQPHDAALAMVVWLAQRRLTPDELEEMAARKRAEEEPSVSNLRRIRRNAEAERDRLEAQGIVDVLAVRREIRRGRRVFDEIETEMDRAVSAQKDWPPTAAGS